MQVRSARRSGGFTLVEAAIVLCVAGVILAVFVPSFVRHLRTSKVGEAPAQLQRLYEAAATYYAAEHPTDEGGRARHCLPPAAGPAPDEPSREPVEVDFADEGTPGHATWQALGFSPKRKLRYRYSFIPAASGCDLGPDDGAPLVIFRAEGDLDGDGVVSTFERQAEATPQGTLEATEGLYEHERIE